MANEITLVSDEPQEGEFNEEEQEALAVGEQLAEAESQLLAGKYENAEQLEQAYIELQRKLGAGEDEPEEIEEVVEEEEVETPAAHALITDASSEYAETGELSAETMAAFSEMSTSDLVQAYIEMQANQQPTAEPTPDLTPSEVNQIKNYAGGEESYTQLMQWAGRTSHSPL